MCVSTEGLFKYYEKIFDFLELNKNHEEIPPILGIDSFANNSKIKSEIFE
jgi:hypothetical protein